MEILSNFQKRCNCFYKLRNVGKFKYMKKMHLEVWGIQSIKYVNIQRIILHSAIVEQK